MAQMPRLLSTILSHCQHFAARFLRPMTMGVRAVVLDADDRVLLVRHSYVAGWHLPGGGVDAGETLPEALVRELREETALETTGKVQLHGMFFNTRHSRRDHVAVYIVRDFDASKDKKPDLEIREVAFFDSQALPSGTGKATRARLAEILKGEPPSDYWMPMANPGLSPETH